jgi:ankyrin repeat protein
LIANALYSADTSNLAIFLEAGLNVNAPDRQGNPPIIDVALNSCYPTIKMLLDHGAEFNVSDKKYKFTPLMNAAAAGDAATTNLLIQKGADLRMLDFAGYNALAWLALADIDNPEIVEQMCKGLGNQLYLKGKDGSDAFSWMEKKGNNKSVQVLSKYKHPQP